MVAIAVEEWNFQEIFAIPIKLLFLKKSFSKSIGYFKKS